MNDQLTKEALDTLERRAQAATPGKWRADPEGVHSVTHGSVFDDENSNHSDCEFVAEADPQMVLALVAYIRCLETERFTLMTELGPTTVREEWKVVQSIITNPRRTSAQKLADLAFEVRLRFPHVDVQTA